MMLDPVRLVRSGLSHVPSDGDDGLPERERKGATAPEHAPGFPVPMPR